MDEFWIDRMAVLGRVNAFLPKPQAFGAAERPVRVSPGWPTGDRLGSTPAVASGRQVLDLALAG